jgi:hypothetical protein
LCNNFVHRTFINIKFIGDHSNCQTSILTNESLHKVNVCVCSLRGRASRSPFIFHRFSPTHKVFVPPKYLSAWWRTITKCSLKLFVGIGSALPQPDTKLDCVILILNRLVRGGVQLGPLGTAATDWPIVACPGWLGWWRIWWNED